MIELDTQIIPTARAMSFLFWARSAFRVRKEFYVTIAALVDEYAQVSRQYMPLDRIKAGG